MIRNTSGSLHQPSFRIPFKTFMVSGIQATNSSECYSRPQSPPIIIPLCGEWELPPRPLQPFSTRSAPTVQEVPLPPTLRTTPSDKTLCDVSQGLQGPLYRFQGSFNPSDGQTVRLGLPPPATLLSASGPSNAETSVTGRNDCARCPPLQISNCRPQNGTTWEWGQ